ncbi:MAG TPA: glutamate--cysteine ligase [Citricoccus sp.]
MTVLDPAMAAQRGASGIRAFSVSEGLLLVEPESLEPLPAGEWAAHSPVADGGHRVSAELQQEQLTVTAPPQTSLADQLAAIRAGREAAARAAAPVSGRVAALGTAPGAVVPHLVDDPRHRRLGEQFGLTVEERLVNGLHVRVEVSCLEEGVVVLDRLRLWLPALLAISANSPFWQGQDTGFASYRYQALSRLPASGPTERFGSTARYERHAGLLRAAGLPQQDPLRYHDAGIVADGTAVEARIADVCLDPQDAAVVATLVRALVEVSVRLSVTVHGAVPGLPASILQAWSWVASRYGVEDRLVDPTTGTPAPAGDVLARLLDLVRPVLAEYGEEQQVETVVADILRRGTGARRQRQAYAARHEPRDVIADALAATHAPEPVLPLGQTGPRDEPSTADGGWTGGPGNSR